jgi:uncharacterized protein YheU (UPF0270 family)
VTGAGVVKVPVAALSRDALLGVIDDYINREGTDYGHRDFDIDEKRAAVLRALQDGRAVITYDAASRTTTIVVSDRSTGG